MTGERRVPVTIVTGFLGSGKTTLVNHLLEHGRLGRVAALVNDIGEVDIDAALVSEIADEVVQLSNGCICCTINGDLRQAAEKVLALTPPVDRLVVETTGLADPLPVGLTFLQTELRARCALEAVVTVVDCANFALDLFGANAAMAQIAHADIIVLNKIDLAGDEEVEALADRISVIKPRARQLRAAHGRVPAPAIVSVAGEPALSAAEDRGHGCESHRHLIDDGFTAHAYRLDRRVSASALQAWLDRGLGDAIYRAKGIVRLDRPRGAFLFQLCGGRASFEPFEGSVAETRLVFIGRDVDAAALAAKVEAILVPEEIAASEPACAAPAA